MIALALSWEHLSEAWSAWLLERSIAAAAALAVVGLVVFALRRRLSAHAPSHLLLLPVLVLLVPLERWLPTHWPQPIPAAAAVAAVAAAEPTEAPGVVAVAVSAAPPAIEQEGPAHSTALSAAAPVVAPSAPAARSTVPILGALLGLWLLVVVAGGVALAVRQVRADRRLRRLGRGAPDGLQVLFDRLCSERGFDQPIALRVVAGLSSPIATGVFRRAVCVPPAIEAQLSAIQLRFVLLHELEHHARRDVLVEGLLRLVRLGFWFHPVAWLVPAAHRRWREYACDEAAVARAGAARRVPVADALMTLLQLASDAPRPAGALASFSPSTHTMKTRLERILDRSRSPRRSLSASSLAAVALIGLGALTAARAQQPQTRQDPARRAAPEQPTDPRTQAPPRKPDGDVARAIDQGIAWLLRQQLPDGSWDLGPDPDPQRTYRDHNRVHVTGLALRAVLHGWKGPRHLEVVRAVERGDNFLQHSQNDKGLIGAGEPLASTYGHAQALRALSAIQKVIPDEQRLECLQRAVAWAEYARNPYKGWRYEPRDGDNDSKHTALMLLALREAESVGVAIPAAAFQGGRSLLEELTDPRTGRTGFTRRGEPMSRFTTKIGDFPREFSEEPTAMHLLVEAAFGNTVADDAVLAQAAEVVRAVPPRWDRDAGTIDYAYWCFGAQAMAQVGGEAAAEWRRHTHQALLPNRIIEGDAAHWPAVDAWSRPGMEAYATASVVLALRVLP